MVQRAADEDERRNQRRVQACPEGAGEARVAVQNEQVFSMNTSISSPARLCMLKAMMHQHSNVQRLDAFELHHDSCSQQSGHGGCVVVQGKKGGCLGKRLGLWHRATLTAPPLW